MFYVGENNKYSSLSYSLEDGHIVRRNDKRIVDVLVGIDSTPHSFLCCEKTSNRNKNMFLKLVELVKKMIA